MSASKKTSREPTVYTLQVSADESLLPRYNDIATTPQDDDSPPTYESLFGRIEAARQRSTGLADCFVKFLVVILHSVGCVIFTGLLLSIPISMIVVGAVYIDDCPREHYIPIYLIVIGCFAAVKNVGEFCQQIWKRRQRYGDELTESSTASRLCDVCLTCFLVAWFIAGNVWIYRVYDDFDEVPNLKTADRYCNPVLYYFAFWMTTVGYILAFISIGISCCAISAFKCTN